MRSIKKQIFLSTPSIDRHMAGFVTSKMVFFYTTTFLYHALIRQQIFSSFTGHVPESTFSLRAPSLLLVVLCAVLVLTCVGVLIGVVLTKLYLQPYYNIHTYILLLLLY